MRKKKIFIVEDDKNIMDLLTVVLEREGYNVVGVGDGMEALKKIPEVAPQLVILDVMMPKLDGWNVLSTIRANDATRNLPVLICTNKNLVSDLEKAEKLGATGFIYKPFDINQMLEKVRTLLGSS